jgi:hypothetical protein
VSNSLESLQGSLSKGQSLRILGRICGNQSAKIKNSLLNSLMQGILRDEPVGQG